MKKVKIPKVTLEDLEQRFVNAEKLRDEGMYNLWTELLKQQSLVAELERKEKLRVRMEEAAEKDRQEIERRKTCVREIIFVAALTAVTAIIITAACLAS